MLEPGRGIGADLLHPAGIDDAGDPIDGDRGLGDVRRQHDLAPWTGPEHAVLIGRRQVAVESDDGEIALTGQWLQGILGATDLGQAGQEDEQIAGRGIEPPPRAARDEARERCRERRLVQVLDDDGKEPPRTGDERRVEEVGERPAVEGRRHRQERELRTRLALHAANQGEREVGEESALVELVEQHGADPLEERVALQALDEDPLGDEEDPGVTRGVALETDLPADFAPERPPLLVRDPPGGRPGGDAARLEDENLPTAGEARRRESGRHARRLAGPRRRLQHGVAPRSERGEELAEDLVDRQSRHPPMLPVRSGDTYRGHIAGTPWRDTMEGHDEGTR